MFLRTKVLYKNKFNFTITVVKRAIQFYSEQTNNHNSTFFNVIKFIYLTLDKSQSKGYIIFEPGYSQ